jgi:hypothetical protein
MKTHIKLTQLITETSDRLFVSETFVALQAYKLHARSSIDCEGHLCFAGACGAFEENRSIEFPGEIDRVGNFTSGEVANLL